MVARQDPSMTMGKSDRAALYHRVSTLDQHPTLARRELRAAAARLGLRAALVVEEIGSARLVQRPRGRARLSG